MSTTPQERSPIKAISPLLKSQHFSNLSMTNFSWDKTLFEGLQSRKLNTEEDQALYSYSKFTTSNQNSEAKRVKESAYHIPTNYPMNDDPYNPMKDYPQLLSQPKSNSTTENSKQKSQQEDVQTTLQELNKRVTQDQQTILQLQNTIQEKDKIIVRLQKYNQWIICQKDQTIRLHTQREDSSSVKQTKKLQDRITEVESMLKQSEEKLLSTHRQLSTLEQENSRIRKERLEFEHQYLNLQQYVSRLESTNEQLVLDIRSMDKDKHIKKDLQEVNFKLQLQADDQKCIIQQLTQKLEGLQRSLLERKRSHDNVYQSYRTSISDNNSQHPLVTRTSTGTNEYDAGHQQKFIECIVDMVSNCHPNQSRPSLKKCWKLLKQILQEYMELKKADTHRQYMKSSLKEGFEPKSHQQSRDNSNSFKT